MELVMVESSKIEARRLDLQCGKGFQDKHSECRTITEADKKYTLENDTPEEPTGGILKEINCNLDCLSKHVRRKRPDMKVYEPKVNLYASRVNKNPSAAYNNLLKREEESGMLLKETNSHNNSRGLSHLVGTKSNVSRKDEVLPKEVPVYLSPDSVSLANQDLFKDKSSKQVVEVETVKVSGNSGKHFTEVSDNPPLNSKSWADQVEEYLSSSAFLEEGEAVDKSSPSDYVVDPVTVSENSRIHSTKILDCPPQKSKSWADQVEEYLSSSALLEEGEAIDNYSLSEYEEDQLKVSGNRMYSTEVSDYSSQNSNSLDVQVEECSSSSALEKGKAEDNSMIGLQSNLLNDVGHQDICFSSGYSSSSEGDNNLILPEMDQKNNDEEFFNSFQRHTPWDPDYNPSVPSESDILRFVKARNAIVERQIAFFDKLVVEDDSSKGNMVKRLTIPEKSKSEAVSARTPTLKRPCTPAVMNPPETKETKSRVTSDASLKNIDDENKLLISPKQFIERQAACFDEMAFFIHPPVPKKVSMPSPTFQVPVGYNDVTIKQFLAGHKQVDWNMPTFDQMDIHKVPAKSILRDIPDMIFPFYVPCPKIDHRFCATNCWSSRDSTYLDGSSYIPPPRPVAKKV